MASANHLGFDAGELGWFPSIAFGRALPLLAAGVATIAVAGLLGSVPGLRVLGRLRSDYIPMAPATAVSFLMLCSALFGLVRARVLALVKILGRRCSWRSSARDVVIPTLEDSRLNDPFSGSSGPPGEAQ